MISGIAAERLFTCAHFPEYLWQRAFAQEWVPHDGAAVERRRSFAGELFVRRRLYFCGVDHEALGRRAYVVKREASQQGQVMTGCRLQYPNVGGGHNLNGFDAIVEGALSCM